MGPVKPGRLSNQVLRGALLLAGVMLLLACASQDVDANSELRPPEDAPAEPPPTPGETHAEQASSGSTGTIQALSEDREPDRPEQPLAGGYARTDLDAQIVVDSMAVFQAVLQGGLDGMPGSVNVASAEILAETPDQPITILHVIEAATQVVAGTNVWLRATYEPGERELSAILWHRLDGVVELMEIDFDFTEGDWSPVAER